MNKRRLSREKTWARLLLADAVAFLMGGHLRDDLLGEDVSPPQRADEQERSPESHPDTRQEMETLLWPVSALEIETVTAFANLAEHPHQEPERLLGYGAASYPNLCPNLSDLTMSPRMDTNQHEFSFICVHPRSSAAPVV